MHGTYDTDDARAFGFTGSWKEFAPIAFTNLLLTIVTLGIYHFWAKTRVRRYLWAHTRFIDEQLEWTGTGLELFLGYLLAVVFFFIPFGIINLVVQGVLLRGHEGAAMLIVGTLYVLLLYLFGAAMFRALRYRLSRTLWRGIRGGSDSQGFAYGWSYLWRTVVGSLVAGLLIPWSMTKLWNERWRAMSFGPMQFGSDANWGTIFPRFLAFYLVPILLVIGIMVIAALGVMGGASFGSRVPPQPGPGLIIAVIAAALAFYIVFFGILGLVAMFYYSAFYREAIGSMTLGDLSFAFEARTREWVMLYLGNIALVAVTLGIGTIFVPYRNWAFFIRHMNAFGDVRLDELTQSTTRKPGQGEGLLDAFDVGAF